MKSQAHIHMRGKLFLCIASVEIGHPNKSDTTSIEYISIVFGIRLHCFHCILSWSLLFREPVMRPIAIAVS